MESRIEEDSKHFQDLSAFKNRLKDFDIKYPGEEGMKMENMDHHNKHNRYYLPYVKGYGWISVPDFQQLKLQDPNIKDEPISGEYRRYISLDQVKNKNDSCSDINCAKELMFCSIVFYTHPYQGIVKICSIMTNFQK